ncbi:type II secretion system protein [Eubacterium sp. 1001713B170207_170306_E7]|uniref:type II secretion system protein n=1 Tax=Eubacterium sp. 1001713B170207_170306_E7 TaxID=2787097 RepID=UPI00189B1654|nr:type II secretion system protein [Eubacterium sp. 1001713B170207_170306_E7]
MRFDRKPENLIKDTSGFTMMELITVIVVIALLAVIIIPGYLHFIDDAKKDAVIAEARTIYLAAQIRATELKSAETPESPYRIPDADDLRELVGPDDIYVGVTKLTIVDDNRDGSIDKIEMIKNNINVIIEPGKNVIVDGKVRTVYSKDDQK